jgi:peptide-methionine (R)-S-oxide reductase
LIDTISERRAGEGITSKTSETTLRSDDSVFVSLTKQSEHYRLRYGSGDTWLVETVALDQKVDLTNKEWLVILSPQQFYVMRRAGTELPSFSGNALDHHNGTYVCSACGNPLYSAETKFNSGTGWPSFWQPIRKEAIHESSTSSAIFGVEISCARCGSHLGHVFNDGPPPTGLRYCMNAVALTYREASPGSAPALPRAGQNRP